MNFLLIVVLLLILLFVLATAKKIFGGFWLINPVVLSVLYFVFVMFPGFVFVSSADVLYSALLAYNLWFLGVLCSVVFSGYLFSLRLGAWNVKSGIPKGSVSVLWFYTLLSLPAIFLMFMMLDRIPLLIGVKSIFGFGDVTMHAARQMNTLGHRSGDVSYFGQGYIRQIYTVVSPVFLIALLVYNSARNNKNGNIYLMLLVLLLATLMNAQIWLAVHLLILFFMAKFYIVSSREYGFNSVLIFRNGVLGYFVLVGFVFILRYMQYLQGRYFDDFFLDTIQRIYSSGGVELFSIFPDYQPLRYGATWLNDLSGILPGSVESFSYEVHYLVHGGSWGFTLSPGIVASAYVNFGFVGVFFTAFFISLLFVVLFQYLIYSRQVISIALAIYLSRQFMLGMPGDIGSYVVALLTAFFIYASYFLLKSLLFSRFAFGKATL